MGDYKYTDELTHYGVKGMKWGVRRKQKIVNSAAQKAAVWQKVANEGAKQYESYAKKMFSDKKPSKVDKETSYKLNMAVSKEFARKAKEYEKMRKSYQTMKISEISKEDINRAKRFLNEKMTIDVSSYKITNM